MDFWQIAGGFFLAFLSHNAYTRLKWRLGYRPEQFDATQANIAAKECAIAYAGRVAATVKERSGEEMSENAKKECNAEMYEFAKWVIEMYVRRMMLPKLDTTSDPKGGRIPLEV